MFDAATLVAYLSAQTPLARAQAVRDQLGSGQLTGELRDGATLKFSGTIAGPLVAHDDGSLTIAGALAGVVLEGGTPDAASWTFTLRRADGARSIVGSFGPGGRFRLSGGSLQVGAGLRLNLTMVPPGGTAAALAAGALTRVQAGGAVTTGIRLAGAATGKAQGAGAVTTGVKLAGAAVGKATAAGAFASSDPLDLPLVTESTFNAAYQGYFNTNTDFEYGGSGMAVGPDNTLYLAGLHQDASVGRLNIASIGQLATTVKAPVTIPGSTISSAPSGYRNGGTLVYNNRVIVAKLTYYEAPMTAWCCAANLALTSFGSINGMARARGGRIRAFCSGMGHVPAEWQGILGGPAYALGGSLQQISEASCGPAFGVFDPDTVLSGGGNVPFADLLWYDDSRPVEPFTPAHPGFTQYNSAGGTDYLSIQTLKTGTAFIYPGSRSLLFVYGHAYGPYGNAGSDGCYPGSSVHSAPFRLQVVAYDLRDLVAVKNGTKNPWEPKPYGWWLLGPDDYGALGVCVYLEQGCFAFDPTNRKLYGCRELQSGNSGRINVWNIGTL